MQLQRKQYYHRLFSFLWVGFSILAAAPCRSHALKATRSEKELKVLFEALSESRASDQACALFQHVEAAEEDAVDGLLPYLRSPSVTCRHAAIIALGIAGGTKAEKNLLAMLGDNGDLEPQEVTVLSLGYMSSRAAVPVLLDIVQDKKDRAFGSKTLPLRQNAAIALGVIGDPSAVSVLLRCIDNDRLNRNALCLALAALNDHWQPKDMEGLVHSRNDSLRKFGGLLLGEMEDTKACLWLIDLLKDKNFSVREAAAISLGRMGRMESLGALRQAVQDPNPQVREAVLMAIERLVKPEKCKYFNNCTLWFFSLSQPFIQDRLQAMKGKAAGSGPSSGVLPTGRTTVPPGFGSPRPFVAQSNRGWCGTGNHGSKGGSYAADHIPSSNGSEGRDSPKAADVPKGDSAKENSPASGHNETGNVDKTSDKATVETSTLLKKEVCEELMDIIRQLQLMECR